MGLSLLKLVKFSFLFLLFATGFITPVNKDYQKKLTVTSFVENIHQWQEHEHASLLAISQLRHQSATAPSLATHAAEAVAAHQCHERDSDVTFTSKVK